MISKELLSEVINIKIEDIIDLKMFGKDLKYYEKCLYGFCCDGRLSDNKDSIRKSINIYELAHKCKEWAFDKGFAFKIEYLGKKDINIQLINYRNEETEYSKDFYNIEHIEYIIIPCQWILESKKEGN